MVKKRGNGQGGAYKRGKTWTAFLTRCVDENGMPLAKRVKKTKGGFETKREALDHVSTLANEPIASEKEAITFKQLYDRWEPTHEAGQSTIVCYRSGFKHFSPLWNTPISQITIDDLQECLDECEKGKRTRQNMKTVCGLLYKYAIPRQNISPGNLNLGSYLKVGDGETVPKQGFTPEQLEVIKTHVNDVPFVDLIYAHCYLGFRPSELLALSINDYDRKNRAFTGGAKTDAGKDRVVTVSPKIQAIVDKYTKDKIGGAVFTKPDGGTLSLKEYRSAFYLSLEEMGFANPLLANGQRTLTPHSCRHTFATLMKVVPAPDKDKLRLIGHASEEMLRYYQDVNLEDLRAITNAL